MSKENLQHSVSFRPCQPGPPFAYFCYPYCVSRAGPACPWAAPAEGWSGPRGYRDLTSLPVDRWVMCRPASEHPTLPSITHTPGWGSPEEGRMESATFIVGFLKETPDVQGSLTLWTLGRVWNPDPSLSTHPHPVCALVGRHKGLLGPWEAGC